MGQCLIKIQNLFGMLESKLKEVEHKVEEQVDEYEAADVESGIDP